MTDLPVKSFGEDTPIGGIHPDALIPSISCAEAIELSQAGNLGTDESLMLMKHLSEEQEHMADCPVHEQGYLDRLRSQFAAQFE